MKGFAERQTERAGTEIALPVRVLHILGSVQRGGTESVVFNYYRHIDRAKIQFDLAVDDNSPYEIPEEILSLGARVYRIPPYSRLPAYWNAIRRICAEEKYPIVHSHMNTLSVFPLSAARAAGVPVRIAHSHSTAGQGMDFKRDLMKYALRPFANVFATHAFACSNYAGRWLFGRAGFTVMPNAIDADRFAYDPQKRDAVREELGLQGKFVVGHVGRLSPQKNHLFLLDVFAEVRQRGGDCALMLVGGPGPSGEAIERELRAKAERMGLSDRILFMGAREDISGLYQAMDVFVLPSLYEGLGIAAVEAQCSGLPCALSDRVPQECKVTGEVQFLPLKAPLSLWAERTLSFRGTPRRNEAERVREAGFDIEKEAARYQALILSLSRERRRS